MEYVFIDKYGKLICYKSCIKQDAFCLKDDLFIVTSSKLCMKIKNKISNDFGMFNPNIIDIDETRKIYRLVNKNFLYDENNKLIKIGDFEILYDNQERFYKICNKLIKYYDDDSIKEVV